jgi:SAM-dependent methyltransferase
VPRRFIATLDEWFRRFRRSLRVHGVRGTTRVAIRSAVTWRGRRRWIEEGRSWDVQHGVNTAGIVPLHLLAIDSPHRDLGVRYQASHPEGFRALIHNLPRPPEELTFIDLGAGKGRALLLASEFPFRRVLGVEFAPALAEIARDNVERFRSPRTVCEDVSVICADAVDYELPDEPAVVYIYNSFEAPVMRKVIANLQRSKASNARQLYLILVNCNLDPGLLRQRGFRRVLAHEHGEVHEAQ